MQKLDTRSFALAGAIYVAAFVALPTIAALLGIRASSPLWRVEQMPGGFKVLDASTVTLPFAHAPNCCRILSQ
jgi:hypothetical protein